MNNIASAIRNYIPICLASVGLLTVLPAIAQTAGQPADPSGSFQITQSSQSTSGSFEGRGVAQGSAFTRGRNASVSLTIDGENFGLELAEPPGTRARVQYRGTISRQTSTGTNSFSLNGRVRSFNSTDNLRLRGVTTGTCRIEVFDARVVSSTCNTVAENSRTEFLGLEQF